MPVIPTNVENNGAARTFTQTVTPGVNLFYRVEITFP